MKNRPVYSMVEAMNAVVATTESNVDLTTPAPLLSVLGWLDDLLEQAVTAAGLLHGPEAAADPYRGLYITQSHVERLLDQKADGPTLAKEARESKWRLLEKVAGCPSLEWLMQVFGLSGFDIGLVLIALAPEIDLRYERLYAYLQDDVSRRRPTVDLALNLLSSSVSEKPGCRAHFSSDAPLFRNGLMHLVPDPHHLRPPLLSHYLKLDEQIVDLLLGAGGLDARLSPFCQLIDPNVTLEAAPLTYELKQSLAAIIVNSRETCRPLRLYFHGRRGAGKRLVAEAIGRAHV